MDRGVGRIRDKGLRGRKANRRSESRALGKALETKGYGDKSQGVAGFRFLDGA